MLIAAVTNSGTSDFRIALVGLGGALIGALIGFGGLMIESRNASRRAFRSELRQHHRDFVALLSRYEIVLEQVELGETLLAHADERLTNAEDEENAVRNELETARSVCVERLLSARVELREKQAEMGAMCDGLSSVAPYPVSQVAWRLAITSYAQYRGALMAVLSVAMRRHLALTWRERNAARQELESELRKPWLVGVLATVPTDQT